MVAGGDMEAAGGGHTALWSPLILVSTSSYGGSRRSRRVRRGGWDIPVHREPREPNH